MPPRRSTRAGSAKPAEKPATRQAAKPAAKAKTTEKPTKAAAKPAAKPAKNAEKPAAKATTRGRSAATTKRVASPENSPPPPAKRSRAAPRIVENGADAADEEEPAPRMKKAPATRKPAQKKPSPVHTQDRPYFNPLPTPPEHLHPAPLLFIWGTGNFGQFGMGPDLLGEYDKPTRNKWVEKNIDMDGERVRGFVLRCRGHPVHSECVCSLSQQTYRPPRTSN